jgi:hypothetical protein
MKHGGKIAETAAGQEGKKKRISFALYAGLFLVLPPFRRSCRLGGPVSGTADPCYFLLDFPATGLSKEPTQKTGMRPNLASFANAKRILLKDVTLPIF